MIERASRASTGKACPGKGQRGQHPIGVPAARPDGWGTGDRRNRPAATGCPNLKNSMDDQHGKKMKPRPPSRIGKGPTPGSFKPGVSGNPNGRPRMPNAAAEKIRERVDLDRVLDLVDVVLAETSTADERADARDRLAVVLPVLDRGYTKPPQGMDVTVGASQAPQRDWSAMPLEERRELLNRVRAIPVLGEGGDK